VRRGIGSASAKGFALGALRSVIEELRAEDVDSWPVGQIADDLVEFELFSGWFEAERSRRLALFEDKRGVDIEGHSSVTAFLKHRCRMSGASAHRAVGLAHRLPTMPVVNQAFGNGDISLDQVRVLANVPEYLQQELARDEATLTEAIEPLSVADTRRVVEYWRSAVDGPGGDATAEELLGRRYMHASQTWEGMVKVDGLLDPVEGDLFLTALGGCYPTPVAGRPPDAGATSG
jgi:hypothetical protein